MIRRSIVGSNSIVLQACYTFDAGPNACLFMLESDVALVAKVVKHFFPPNGDEKSAFMRGVTIEDEPDSAHTQVCTHVYYETLSISIVV